MTVNAFVTIPRCYDSHVHWLSTGEVLNQIDLTAMNSVADLRHQSQFIKPNRGDWIVGFGWDQSRWPAQDVPDHKILDELFPNHPVALSRIDGHALWVNSKAMQLAEIATLKTLKLPGGRIELNSQGLPSGIFLDSARTAIEAKIPCPSRDDLKQYLLSAMEVFNRAGFSHIRDVGGSLRDWQLAQELESNLQLSLFCEMYFNLEDIDHLTHRMDEILRCRQEPSSQLRVSGLKLFYDGALGSEGALLSQPYPSGKRGFHLYELAKIEEIFTRCWEQEIPVAIHTLGDEAVHQIVLVAHRLKEREIEGELNLEHCEVVRSETIRLMKGLALRCHLQPSHYLSDRRWLRQKLGHLYKDCFPWKRLLEAGVPINFGSDSPIEHPSLQRTSEALEAAALEGIGAPPVSPWSFHSHPNGGWGGNCATRLYADGSVQLYFQKS